ncbi:MAG: M20 family metallopeptidase [Ginsengibacter sp.]
MLKEKIQSLAKGLHSVTVTHRRHLHSHPELSFKEYNTSAFVSEKLTELGIPFEKKGDTGIVALLKGTKSDSDQIIALRADMDALPITETNDVSYKSQNTGVMHACGHDMHTSSLLATATILNHLQSEFSGTVKFIFQPGEEKIPGGASIMIKEGVLENPKPKNIIGQHVMPELAFGKVGFCAGPYMASSDELYITVTGKGGHGAIPHLNIDPVAITCQLVVALQQIVSRQANPIIPTVLSFGRLIADGATNVIPDKVEIEGTFRTFDNEWREVAHERMKKMAVLLVEGMGGKCDFEIRRGYPVLINEANFTREVRQYTEDFLGKENVIDIDPCMPAEDFAFYSQQIPACFYRIGVSDEANNITSGLHTPTFNIDEKSLETGPGLMAYLALKCLGN